MEINITCGMRLPSNYTNVVVAMPLGACCFLQLGLWIGGETSQGSHGLGARSHRYEVKKIEARQLPSSSRDESEHNAQADRQ